MAGRRRDDDREGRDEASPVYNVVFVDTSLDTHLAMPVSGSDTLSQFKERMEVEHMNCFPEIGKIHINSLKIKYGGNFYHIPDSLVVSSLFVGEREAWSLSADVSKDSTLLLCQFPSNVDIKDDAVTVSKNVIDCAETLPSNMNIRSGVSLSLPGADNVNNIVASVIAEVEADLVQNRNDEMDAPKTSTDLSTEKETVSGVIARLEGEKSPENAVGSPSSAFSDGNSLERKSRRRKKRKVCPEEYASQNTILEDSSHILDESTKDSSNLKIVNSKDSTTDAAKEGLRCLFNSDHQADPSQFKVITKDSGFSTSQYVIEKCGEVFDGGLSPTMAKKSTPEDSQSTLVGDEIGNQHVRFDRSLCLEESVLEESFDGKKNEKRKRTKKVVHAATEILETASPNLDNIENMKLPSDTQNDGEKSVQEEGLDVENSEKGKMRKEDVNTATETFDATLRNLEKTERVKLPCEIQTAGEGSVREENLDQKKIEKRKKKKRDVNSATEILDTTSKNLEKTERMKLPPETGNVGEESVREVNCDGKKNEKRKKRKRDMDTSMNHGKSESMNLISEAQNVDEAKDVLSMKRCSELLMESSNCKSSELAGLDLIQKETSIVPPSSSDPNPIMEPKTSDGIKKKKKRKNRNEATMEKSGVDQSDKLSPDIWPAIVNNECSDFCNDGVDSQLKLDSSMHSNEKMPDANGDGFNTVPLNQKPQQVSNVVSGKGNVEEITKESQEEPASERELQGKELNELKVNLEAEDEKSKKRKKKSSRSSLAGLKDTLQVEDPEFDNKASSKKGVRDFTQSEQVSDSARPLLLSQRSNEALGENQMTRINTSDIETAKNEGEKIDFHEYFGSAKKTGKDEIVSEECQSNEGNRAPKARGRSKIPSLSSSRKQTSASIDKSSACNSETSHKKRRNITSSRPAQGAVAKKAVTKTLPIKLGSVFETDSDRSYEDEKGKVHSGHSTNSPSSSSSESIHTKGESELNLNSARNGTSKATPNLLDSGSKGMTMGMILRNSQIFKQALNRASSQDEIEPTDS